MHSEEIEVDGQLITLKLPVSNIHIVNQTTVRFEDATGPSQCDFSSAEIANQFSDWLLQQSI